MRLRNVSAILAFKLKSWWPWIINGSRFYECSLKVEPTNVLGKFDAITHLFNCYD